MLPKWVSSFVHKIGSQILKFLLIVSVVMHEGDNADSIQSTRLCYWRVQFETIPYSPGANTFFLRSVAPPGEKAIFAFEKSYITSAMRKSVLDAPVMLAYEIYI